MQISILALALCLALCLPGLAQEFRADVSGIVKDQQGGVMPQVSVEAVNLGANDINHAVTNDSGCFSLPVLPLGTYRVTVTANGFKKAVRGQVELRVGEQVHLGASDLRLDGVPNTGTETTSAANMGFVPSPDAVQQFRIQTSNCDAQYGRTAGGTISVSQRESVNRRPFCSSGTRLGRTSTQPSTEGL